MEEARLEAKPGNDGRREAIHRLLLFGSPCLAAAITATGLLFFELRDDLTIASAHRHLLIFGNAALGAMGSGVGGWFSDGTLRERVEAMLGCVALGLVIYFAALGVADAAWTAMKT